MSRVCVWIAGPRAFEAYEPVHRVVNKLAGHYGIGRLVLVSGGAPGVDRLTVQAAEDVGVSMFECKAVWKVWNHKAGPIRNALIAELFPVDLLVAFHYMPLDQTNHKGTQNAIKQARKHHIPVRIIRVKPQVATPSAYDDDSPMGNRARQEAGMPPKPPKRSRRAKARHRRA